MAINFSLVDNGRPIDFLRDMGEALQFKHMQDKLSRDNAMRQQMSNAIDPETGRADAAAMRRAYIAGGDFGGLADYERNQAATLKSQQELARTNYTDLSRLVAGVSDEAGYARARIMAQRLGIDTSFLPDQYSPEVAQEAQELLEALRSPTELTSFQKDMIAGGIDPNSEQGRQLAAQYATNKTAQMFNVGPGEGRYALGPDGTVRTVIAPNNEGAPMGTPASAPPLPPGFVMDGGPTPQASGNFQR